MNKLIISVFLLAVLFGANSCEDSFSQVVEIDLPPHTPLIAVKGFFVEPGFGNMLVADSKGILENRAFNILKDATVIIDAGANQFTGEFQDQAQLFYFQDIIDFESTSSLSLTIEAPGYESVTAEALVPQLIEIAGVWWEEDGGIDLEGYVADLFSIEFDDPSGENYYSLEANYNQSYEYVDQNGDTMYQDNTNRVYLFSNDPLLFQTSNGLLFSDASFDGKTAQLEALGDIYNKPDSITVILNSISRDAYLYERSLELFRQNDGNPFAEPVTVHSNIEGGYGIFAATRSSSKSIEVKK